MSLPIGARLGPYAIVSPLGAGGMGEVYRAHDARLGRDVALKVISPALAHDPDRVARFEREARAASALADAHIVAVFDVGEENGVHFFASELVDGPTLRHVLLDGAMPVRRALELAAQIAQGLAVAHEKGIVHRDLKPENVLIAPGNVAKIADFGLAKTTGAAPASAADSTETGILLGTVTYMSPEQAAGKRLDGRSDQFALGSILCEMLTGKALFRRATGAETLTAILREEPDLAPLGDLDLPPTAAWILERCLSKDPEGRYASTKDLARELQHLRERTSQMRAPALHGAAPPNRRATRRMPVVLLLGVLGGLLAGVLATALLTRRAAVPAQSLSNGLRFLIPPPVPEWFNPSVDTVTLAVSTDGSRLAFITGVGAKRSIWVRALDDAEPHALPGTEGARSLFWSPDGLKLGFFAGGALSTIELGGRAAVRVCDVPVGSGGAATWGGDGTIAFTFTAGEAIYRVPASGGVASVWHERDLEQGESRLGWPQFLPGSREVVYTVRDGAGTSRLGSWSAGQAPRNLGPIASRFEFLDAATLVFARDGALVEQHFDRERGLIGAPTLIAPSVSSFRSSLWAGFAVSRAGTLLWKSAEDSNELVWFDRTGARGARVGTPGTVLEASVSGDGKTVLASRKRPELGTYDVWAYDLARGTESRLTSDPDSEFDALLSPDGKTLFYSAVHGPLPRIVVRDLASGAEHDLLAPGGFQMAQSITSDGRTLAFSRGTEQGFGFWTLALAGTAEPVPLAKGATGEEVRLSPDGSFAAYISDETGVAQLYVTRVAASAERAVVSANGARSIEWTADGKELLYLSEDRQVISIPVSVTPSLELGRPQTLFTIPATSSWVNMTASPDGRRLLANVRLSAAGEQPLNALVGHSAHH